MGNQIEVKKRMSEEIACWRVDTKDMTPNTVLAPDPGIMLVIKIDGVTKTKAGGASTVYGLFNPGKTNKLIGGNKPYEKIEVFAIDQSSEFNAEWGIGGPMAMPCFDREFDVECKAVAYGEYYYKIENYVAFINSFPFEGGVITRDDIREFLRGETTGIIRNGFAADLMGKDLAACQANLAARSKSILKEINDRLDSKGLTVYNFLVHKLDYDMEHLLKRKRLAEAKVAKTIKRHENEGLRDDVTVEAKRANEVDVPIIEALNGSDGKKQNYDRVLVCPRCSEKNEGYANYCKRCGEKLIGGGEHHHKK